MRGICVGLLILSFIAILPAQDLRDPRFVERAQEGFTDIYNLDYDKARKTFEHLAGEFPQHPAPPLYLASILWLEEMNRRQNLDLNRYIFPSYFLGKTHFTMPSQERAAFIQFLQRSEALSNAILQRSPRDKDARYFLSTSLGLRASFAITIDHNLREAFSSGSKANSYSRQLIEEDPAYYDAYLIAGIYDYVVGSIPWYLKWIPFIIGMHGSKQEGMKRLKLASENGVYVKNEAKIVEMVLYARERRFSEALKISDYLTRRFPRNYAFPLSTAQICRIAGWKEQSVAAYMQLMQRVEAKEANFDRLSLQTFRYSLGNDLMTLGRADLAQEQFRKAVEDPQTPVREKALSHLRLGQILDSKGKNAEAAKEYHAVLSLRDVENSHDRARALLKKR